MGFLLNPLGFLGPITTSLPLITSWVYWPLSQLNEFTNSFLGLPKLVYFLFTSYYFHGLTTSFIGLPRPVYSLFTSFYSCKPASHQSCHFSLLGLLPYSLFPYYFPFLPFLYCWASSAIGHFVKNRHQQITWLKIG